MKGKVIAELAVTASVSGKTKWPEERHTTRCMLLRTGVRLSSKSGRRGAEACNPFVSVSPDRNNPAFHVSLKLLRRREQTQAKQFKDIWGFMISPEPPTSVSVMLQAKGKC